MCHEELDIPGALLFASPTKKGLCAKYHICVSCEASLVQFIIKKMLRKAKFFKRNHEN